MEEDLVKKVSGGKASVLRVGGVEERHNGFYAPATISLVRRMNPDGYPLSYSLVDAGGFGREEGKNIRILLCLEGFREEDIDGIMVTHNHPDHIGNIGSFEKAKVIMPDSDFMVGESNLFHFDNEADFFENPGNKKRVYPQTVMVSTPGHSGWDASYVFEGEGRIAMVGDLFWSQEDWEEDSQFMDLCVNNNIQKRSRDYVREELKPEVVIPGHGPAFAPQY